GAIDLARAFHSERLVRAFGVEFGDKGIEAGLLLQTVLPWRSGGFLLQREMHALVAAVLLRLAGLDALDGDAEAQPPDREPGEVEERIWAGEGNAVVGADGERESALGEQPFEGGEGELFACGVERFAHEQEA